MIQNFWFSTVIKLCFRNQKLPIKFTYLTNFLVFVLRKFFFFLHYLYQRSQNRGNFDWIDISDCKKKSFLKIWFKNFNIC